MTSTQLIPKIEALLFVSGEPLSVSRLAKLLSVKPAQIVEALESLGARYRDDPQSGLVLITDNGEAELATKGDLAPVVATLTKSVLQEELSRPALEVLAIIAYRAPVTRAQIEAIRGVNCSFTLRNLLLRGLIDRSDNPGDSREFLYRPTMSLLEKIGLERREALPDFAILNSDERLTVLFDPKTTREDH